MSNFPKTVDKLKTGHLTSDTILCKFVQGDKSQVVFLEYKEDFHLPEHSHTDEFGVVVNGVLELTMDGETKNYYKGDMFYIPNGTIHSAWFKNEFAAMIYFDEPNRFKEI